MGRVRAGEIGRREGQVGCEHFGCQWRVQCAGQQEELKANLQIETGGIL